MTQNLIPDSLASWTYEAVRALCAVGLTESDRHDFKYGLTNAENTTKICCAFANTFGGYLVFGVREANKNFEIEGIEPDGELYGKLIAKVRVTPDIEIPPPMLITVPGAARLLYVFQIPRSVRRPHLPVPPGERFFWKRQGSSCVQMTLEEIRYQISNYEEKREKLALLLMDLSHKLRSLNEQARIGDWSYTGDIFSFELIDSIVAETYAILKSDVQSIGVLDTLRKELLLLNAEKQKLISIISIDRSPDTKRYYTREYRTLVQNTLPHANMIVEQVERSFREKFSVENPYKTIAQG
jgi:hypothetical protein